MRRSEENVACVFSYKTSGDIFGPWLFDIEGARIELRRTDDWHGSRRPTSSSAEAIHGHHRQRRTTASAVGRPGDRSYEQTDRPRPSRGRSGPGVQHGRDRLDWRLVVHRPADLKKVISSRARPSRWRAAGRTSTQATCSGPGYRRYWRHWRRSPKHPSKPACLRPGTPGFKRRSSMCLTPSVLDDSGEGLRCGSGHERGSDDGDLLLLSVRP